VYENVSKEAWQGWLRYQTMLINENRLSWLMPVPASIWQQLDAYFFGQVPMHRLATRHRSSNCFKPPARGLFCLHTSSPLARNRMSQSHELLLNRELGLIDQPQSTGPGRRPKPAAARTPEIPVHRLLQSGRIL
jgi:hypothetical protein